MHELRDAQQVLRLQPKGVRPGQKYAVDPRGLPFEEALLGLAQRVVVPGLRLQQVGLDVF